MPLLGAVSELMGTTGDVQHMQCPAKLFPVSLFRCCPAAGLVQVVLRRKCLETLQECLHCLGTQGGWRSRGGSEARPHAALASCTVNTTPEGCSCNLSSDWSRGWSRALLSQHPPRIMLLVDVLRVRVLVCGITISHSQRFFPVTSKPGLLLLFAPPPRPVVFCQCGGLNLEL